MYILSLLTVNLFASAQNSFSGVVTDEKQETLPGAQVLLLKNDSLYAGALTDTAGYFSIQNLHADNYLLRILYLGYTPYEENRLIKGEMNGRFMLAKEMKVDLDEVEVVAHRSDIVKRTATGQIFHLSEHAKNSNDPYLALSEIPRLTVNNALRTIAMDDGTTPLILIDGMTVNSGVTPIDPKDIESVEIMDVVNARYLRTGARHIVNIKLKKTRSRYTFFEVMNRHDIPWREGMGAVYFEIGNPKYSLYGRGAGDYTHDDNVGTKGWQRNNNYYKFSEGNGQTNSRNFLGELLFKSRLTENDYLAAHVYGKYDKNKNKTGGEGSYETGDKQDFNYASQNRDNSYIWTGSLYHRHTFLHNQLLETTLAYNYNQNRNEGERSETYPDWLYRYLYEYRNRRSSGSLNIDYSRSWGETSSLNIGNETKYMDDHIHQISENYPVFHHREWNTYLYASFSSSIKKFNYMGSAGVEAIWLKAGKASNGYVKPRASASGTYVLDDRNSARVGYVLTNEAPGIGQLNPYNTSTDSLVINRGNPDLAPMQEHEFSLSYTFNKAGLYLTPYASYQIFTDIIEPSGYTENNIYISSFRNADRFRSLLAGGSVSYRLGTWGQIYVSGYHKVDYFSGQNAHNSFLFEAGMMARYRKWLFNMNYDYRNYTYTATSRTQYHNANYSLAQIQYNFTPNFYISVGLQYFTGAVKQDTEVYGESYQSFTSERMNDLNIRPWILIRYTLRKNDKQKIKLDNVVTGKEKGITL